jgi:hypothetical protein
VQKEEVKVTVKEALNESDRILREAKLGRLYVRLDWDIVTGKKLEASQRLSEPNGS